MTQALNAHINKKKGIKIGKKTQNLVPSYYCLYSPFSKIRNKGKIVSAG
jgi:hypothetical protein